MMQDESYDVAVIGGGPAGLSAALSAYRAHARVVLIEREAKPGGILKQCIHDGFGLVRFGEKLAGCEYAQRFIDELQDTDIAVALSCFVTQIAKEGAGFCLTASAATGMRCMHVKTLVLATGCRERTARQIAVHGTRPAGIFTAGSAQYYTNILGKLPTRRCVILGSGDIGLIMARRLTLEGAKVVGVYEAKSTPSGLARNLYQCLDDFAIPLHTSHTVTRVFGAQRVEAVCDAERAAQFGEGDGDGPVGDPLAGRGQSEAPSTGLQQATARQQGGVRVQWHVRLRFDSRGLQQRDVSGV